MRHNIRPTPFESQLNPLRPIPFSGPLAIMIDVAPWIIAIPAQGIELSHSHIVCTFSPSRINKQTISSQEWLSFLQEQSTLKLQLINPPDDLPLTVLVTTPISVTSDHLGIVLRLEFNSRQNEIEEAIIRYHQFAAE